MKKLIMFILGIFVLNNDINTTKKLAYNKGYELSQQFKKYKEWDEFIEPLIIRQFAFIFGVSNAFIKGLVSDNKPNKNLEDSLKLLNKKD